MKFAILLLALALPQGKLDDPVPPRVTATALAAVTRVSHKLDDGGGWPPRSQAVALQLGEAESRRDDADAVPPSPPATPSPKTVPVPVPVRPSAQAAVASVPASTAPVAAPATYCTPGGACGVAAPAAAPVPYRYQYPQTVPYGAAPPALYQYQGPALRPAPVRFRGFRGLRGRLAPVRGVRLGAFGGC